MESFNAGYNTNVSPIGESTFEPKGTRDEKPANSPLMKPEVQAGRIVSKVKRVGTSFGIALPEDVREAIKVYGAAQRYQPTFDALPDLSTATVDDLDFLASKYAEVIVKQEYATKAKTLLLVNLALDVQRKFYASLREIENQLRPQFDETVRSYRESVKVLGRPGADYRDLVQRGGQVVLHYENAQNRQKELDDYAKFIAHDIRGESAGRDEYWEYIVDQDDPRVRPALAGFSQHLLGDDRFDYAMFHAALNDLPFKLELR